MRRIKLAVSKSKYKEVLVDIRQANQDLREVTRQNIVLEPIKRKRQGRRLIGDLRLIRRLAASLYQVLMNDKTWNCKCKMHHLASLRLEARPKTNQDFKADAAKTPAFRVLLSLAADNREANGTAHWQEIEILHSPEAQASIKEPQTERNPDRYVEGPVDLFGLLP